VSEAAREAPASAGKTGGKTWTQAYQQRQTGKRIANNLNKNQLGAASQLSAAAAHSGALTG
jgi:hypothetical protein